jgi:hypothetical protein
MEGFDCVTTKSQAAKELRDMDCENQKEDIIALADKWCNTFSGPKTVPVEQNCQQQGCQPEAEGQRWNCVSQKP